jgi:hypothetical protein
MEVFNTVTFTSENFKPFLPDDCQVNPGRYGAELAYWLSAQLANANVITSYPNYEDWGWFLDYANDKGEEFRLCCGNIEGSDTEWMCFVEPLSKGFFKGKADIASASALMDALKHILGSAQGISAVEWTRENNG